MSHHSGSESDQKDLTKSKNEEFSSTSGATGARPKRTVKKEFPSKSRSSNKNERTTGTSTKRTSKKAFFHKGGGGKFKLIKPKIYLAGGNIGNIKHDGSGETFNVMKMANNGGSITANEYGTRSTLTVQTPPGNTSAEGSPSTSGRTRRKRKAKKNRSTSPSRTPKRRGSDNSKNKKEGIQLSDSIWCFSELRLAKKGKVFAGVQKSKALSEQQQLAIKLIWQYTEKNRREAENLLKLKSHTNVVGIVHADVYEAEPGVECLYIAMERCDTLNLEDYIEKRKSKNVPFNPIEAFEHAKQVIAGIDHIHGCNILHRDLKPSNVLFSRCGRYLKICDFGLSKELRNGLSMTGLSTLKATMDGYRAPETYNENVITKMADIFSLALVLYHLLSYGFHPFGIHPTSWCYNIQNGQGLDLSRLRVPFLKIVRELLEKMLNFKPKSRLKIGQVKKNESMKLDWFPLITESLVPIWNGVVKDRKGADMLSCRLYRSPSLQDVIKIDESGWKFEMDTVRYFDISSLKKVTDEEPSGYIVTSKDELQRLTDKLARNLMGWIDISKYGKESKVIVLLSKPGYPELFGYFFPDTRIMTSLFGNLASRQRSTPQKPVAGLDTHPLASACNQPSNLQAQASEPSSTSAEPAPVSSGITSGIVDQDSTKEQEAAPAADQCKETSSGLIPWWIYTGDLQK